MVTATAYWITGAGRGGLHRERLPEPGPGEVLVETLYSGVSPGTERLVHAGAVPADVAQIMRAPFQVGDFPYPVKYGYLAVGTVRAGPERLIGREVFCLHPHQDRFVVPVAAVHPLPSGVPAPRAVLAGTLQTVVNAIWDCPPQLGDSVTVIGAGIIGACLAAVLSHFPLMRLQVIDPDERTGPSVAAFGARRIDPVDAQGDCDIVFHTSATAAGLALGLSLLRPERTLMELSWYGTHNPEVPLGEDFHAKRLAIRASQVSTLAAAGRMGRTREDQWATVFKLLHDARFDSLLTDPIPFDRLPEDLGRRSPGQCPLVVYPAAQEPDNQEQECSV